MSINFNNDFYVPRFKNRAISGEEMKEELEEEKEQEGTTAEENTQGGESDGSVTTWDNIDFRSRFIINTIDKVAIKDITERMQFLMQQFSADDLKGFNLSDEDIENYFKHVVL